MPAGRPKKLTGFDTSLIELMAERQWTNIQIAAALKVDVKTIERNFSPIITRGRQSGRAKLIDLAWKRAENGSDRMLEHLLNRFHGPIEKQRDIQIENTPKEPIVITTQSLEECQKRLFSILHQEIGRLNKVAETELLTQPESSAMLNYTKVVSELKAMKLLEDTEKEVDKNG